MEEKTVLFVDDEENILKTVERQLRLHDFKVFTASRPEDALDILSKEKIVVVVSDERMPHMTGSKLLTHIKEKYPVTIRMIMSGYADFNALQDAINSGEIFKFIPKPWDEEYLVASLNRAFSLYEEQVKKERNQKLINNTLEGVVTTDTNDIIETANMPFLLLTGYSLDEIIRKNIWELFPCFNEEDRFEILDEIYLNRSWQGEASIKLANNLNSKGILAISNHVDQERNHRYHSYTFLSMPELQQIEMELEQKLKYDDNTNFLNQNGLTEKINRLIFSAEQKKRFAIIILYFEQLERLSHLYGTSFLNSATEFISDNIKQEVHQHDICGTLSPTTFAIVLTDNETKEETIEFINELHGRFEVNETIDNHKVKLIPHIGVSFYPTDSTEARKLIDKALLSSEYAVKTGCLDIIYSPDIERQLHSDMLQSKVN